MTFCAHSAAGEFLCDRAMREIYSRPGSHFAAVDQCPKSLLHCGGGGLIGGAHHQVRQARAGVPTDSNISLEAGIYKGKLPRHLVAAHRPIRMASPIPRGESNRAKSLQQDTMEVTGAYTPEVFAYRAEISGLFMALVTRAAITASLQDYGVAELADWDESDAFFRNQRDQVSALSQVFPGL